MSPRKTKPASPGDRLKALFGVGWEPRISFTAAAFPAEVQMKTGGRMSISGVQKKATVALNRTTREIEIVGENSTHILKPDRERYPQIALAENLGMDLAETAGLRVPPHAILPMADGTPAYIVRRFDRLSDGTKLLKEDMASLLQVPTDEKYTGTLEKVGEKIREHASNTYLDLLEFFERVVFNWIIGNGDMHLKNWALLIEPQPNGPSRITLSPSYDVVPTKIYTDDDDTALPINGRKNNLRRSDFLAFAGRLGLDRKAVERSIRNMAARRPAWIEQVRASGLSEERKEKLAALIGETVEKLQEPATGAPLSRPRKPSKPPKPEEPAHEAPFIPDRFIEWITSQEFRATQEMSAFFQGPAGSMEVAACVPSRLDRLEISQPDLLEAMRRAQINTFGWPIGVVLPNEPDRPVPTNDGVEALVRISRLEAKVFDRWVVRRDGSFYLLQSLFEDQRRTNTIFFDTRIVRVTEAILHQAQLYRALGIPEKEPVLMRFRHDGIKDRVLSAANTSTIVATQNRSVASSATRFISASLEELEMRLVDHVYDVVQDLCSLFGFFRLSRIDTVEPIVRNFQKGFIR